LNYDYIIIGGGSAGCVLANRLSADPANRVCLVEAGPVDRNPLIHMPFGIGALVGKAFVNWAFWSTPQRELGGRRTYQPRGKTLGGSSSINATVCTRGHASDYDRWAELGCTGWSYADVLPYFCRSETYRAPLADRDRPFHGTDGPLSVSERRYTNPLSEAFVEAGVQAGYARNDDFNGADQEGVGQFKVFQIDGERCSNARGYLTPEVLARPNLEIRTGLQCTRVLLDGDLATGVECDDGRQRITLNAAREVILSAGAFQSPQLLMLSGIGPREELTRHGIPVVVDAPEVGANLQDHLEVIVETRARSRVGFAARGRGWWTLIKGLFQYLFRRTGPYTSNGPEAGGFIRSRAGEDIPDMQWHFSAVANLKHGLEMSVLLKRFGYIVYVYALRPRSRGWVRLASGNPLDAPEIDPNYLAEPEDVSDLVRGVRKTRELLAQPAFDAHRDVELHPGPDVESDEALEDFVRRTAETTYHPVGTCRMGGDDRSVVDPDLKVRGVRALRVVDASVMPTLVGANTNAGTTMIAEKGADLILLGATAGS